MGIRSPLTTSQLGSVSVFYKPYCPVSMKCQTWSPIPSSLEVDGAHDKFLTCFPHSKCYECQGLDGNVDRGYGLLIFASLIVAPAAVCWILHIKLQANQGRQGLKSQQINHCLLRIWAKVSPQGLYRQHLCPDDLEEQFVGSLFLCWGLHLGRLCQVSNGLSSLSLVNKTQSYKLLSGPWTK